MLLLELDVEPPGDNEVGEGHKEQAGVGDKLVQRARLVEQRERQHPGQQYAPAEAGATAPAVLDNIVPGADRLALPQLVPWEAVFCLITTIDLW